MAPPLPSRPLGIRLSDSPPRPAGGAGKFLSIEIFFDMICPFCKRLFLTIDDFLPQVRGKPVEFLIHPMPQPWHPQSTVLHEAALAVRALEGDEGYNKFMHAYLDDAVYSRFQDIEADNKTRNQMHAELADLYGKVFGKPVEPLENLLAFKPEEPGARNSGNSMTTQLKLHVKYARRLGVHVSPTVFVNGIEAAQISSGWTQQQWAEFIAEQLA